MKKKRLKQQTTRHNSALLVQGHVSFAGPLPHPTILENYDRIMPGAAERILGMAERQSTHRQEIEKDVIRSEVFKARVGTVLGFVLILVAIIAGTWLILQDKQISGLVTIVTAISAPAVALITLQRKEKKG